MLRVIRDVKTIAAAAKRFADLLADGAVAVEKQVTFPGYGPDGLRTLYCARNGRSWSGHKESNSAFMFWFGSDIHKPEPLTPSIEINFPKTFDRSRKGRLLDDGENGIWVGHRGCLGGGRASVPMKEFDQHINGFARETVLLDAAKGKKEKIYVFGSLASQSFLPRLQEYLEEAERIREIKRSEKR